MMEMDIESFAFCFRSSDGTSSLIKHALDIYSYYAITSPERERLWASSFVFPLELCMQCASLKYKLCQKKIMCVFTCIYGLRYSFWAMGCTTQFDVFLNRNCNIWVSKYNSLCIVSSFQKTAINILFNSWKYGCSTKPAFLSMQWRAREPDHCQRSSC